MPLHPQIREYLEQFRDATPLHRMTPEQARRQVRASTAFLGPSENVASARDLKAPARGAELGCRLYFPTEERNAPLIVYFHGGGWVMGDLDSHDGYCRALANRAGMAVAAVDYRLAPEHKYPTAFEDCYAAFVWLAENAAALGADPTRLALAGDSAGGNLAAATALAARDRGGPRARLQALVYPMLDYNFETPSYRENAEGYFLSRADCQWFWSRYLEKEDQGLEPFASPLVAENLADLPPALVLTAEYDPLRDEGEAYARRLMQAGVRATLTRYAGAIHGFARRVNLFDLARRALQEVADALRRELT